MKKLILLIGLLILEISCDGVSEVKNPSEQAEEINPDQGGPENNPKFEPSGSDSESRGTGEWLEFIAEPSCATPPCETSEEDADPEEAPLTGEESDYYSTQGSIPPNVPYYPVRNK